MALKNLIVKHEVIVKVCNYLHDWLLPQVDANIILLLP